MVNPLKASDVVKMRQTQMWSFCLTLSQPVSSPMTVHSEPREKGGVELCAWGSERGEEPCVQGMQVKQTSLFWSFKPLSLKRQLVRNGKKTTTWTFMGFFYLAVRGNLYSSHKVIWVWGFLIYLLAIIKRITHMKVKWKLRDCHCWCVCVP